MKKVFLSFAFVAILFAFSFERGEATCPTGYVPQTIPFPIPGSSPVCYASVEICYQCNPTGISNVIIGTLTVPPCGNISWFLNNANWYTFEDYIYSHINYGSCTPIPCEQGGTPFVVKGKRIICNYVHNIVVDSVHYSTLLIPCDPDGAYFETTYNICWDGSKYVTTYVSSTGFGTPNCSATKPTLPPTGKTWDDPWDTFCFINNCGK